MKRIFFILIVILIPLIHVEAITKDEKKQINKEAKQLEKSGWKSDNNLSIRELLMLAAEYEHEGKMIFVGSAYDYPRLDLAKRAARVNGISELSEFCKHNNSEIKINTISNDTNIESDLMSKTHRSIDASDAMSKVEFLFTLTRNIHKTYDCKIYLFLDVEKLEHKD